MKQYLLIATFAAAGAVLPLQAQTASPADSAAASPAAATSSPASSPAKGHFGGTVSSIDASAKTITVANKKQGVPKTYQLSDSTKITKTDGTVITLGDLKAGDHVHGAFTTGDDGTLQLLTLKVGAKTTTK